MKCWKTQIRLGTGWGVRCRKGSREARITLSKTLIEGYLDYQEMARRSAPAVFHSEELDELIRGLELDDKRRRWVEDMETVLKENIFAGEKIPKRQIPKYYVERYGVNNLYRYGHPEGHRSCYTIFRRDGLGVCPTVLDLMTHREYERRFRYRGR